MKKQFARGESADQISKRLRVSTQIVTEVVEGKWDATEKALALRAMEKNQQEQLGKADAEANKIAQIAAAAAAAINGQSPVVDADALRAKIEAEVRAEMSTELTRGQKAAATRKANQEAALEQEEAAS
jgi:hypothetical protein